MTTAPGEPRAARAVRTGADQSLRVAVVGFGWMGQVHARAYARLLHHYPAAELVPTLVAVADNADDDRLAVALRSYGFAEAYRNWHEVIARHDIDVVSITGPNFLHRDVGVAAASAGKHIWIEKPAGRNAAETEQISTAVRAAGVHSAVGFNYRHVPAVARARTLIAEGRIGRVTSVGIRLLADYAAHPAGALSWRFLAEPAGSGVLGDLASHGIDLGRYLVGEITEVVADAAVMIPERPQPSGAASHFAQGQGPPGAVENEDYVGALLRFATGTRGVLTASRAAVGEQCTYAVEVHGDRGALAWDFRRMGELRLCLDQDYQNASYTTEFVAPGAGDLAAFQPGAGIAMGYDDLKVVEAERLVTAIATGVESGATIEDAVAAARVVDALASSARERRWTAV